MIGRPKVLLFVTLVGFAVVSTFSGRISPYYYDVIIGIGINIILAASLNLINGYTGQFSLGHAGFMAVGAYSSAWLTLTFGYSFGLGTFSTTTTYLLALLSGGLLSALVGLAVGIPSLRLRGDYLAIVT